MSQSVSYDYVSADELEEAFRIEAAGYPADEAASLEQLRLRQEVAPDLFLGAYIPKNDGRKLIGFVCATLTLGRSLTPESMSSHIPGATSVCIHSVCISPDHRRQRIALNLLKEYIRRAGEKGYERILLITQEELRPLYEKAGFLFLRNSAVVHGSRPWFEMQKILHTPPLEDEPQAIPVGLWDALQRSSTRTRPRAQLLSAFEAGLQDVHDDSFRNRFDLACPREGCGSLILKNGIALLTEHDNVQMEPAGTDHALLPPSPPGTSSRWWKVTPTAMAFENIGFSRGIPSINPAQRRMKLLLCAECDLGPLGWCEEGGSEFWLANDRVGYRV